MKFDQPVFLVLPYVCILSKSQALRGAHDMDFLIFLPLLVILIFLPLTLFDRRWKKYVPPQVQYVFIICTTIFFLLLQEWIIAGFTGMIFVLAYIDNEKDRRPATNDEQQDGEESVE